MPQGDILKGRHGIAAHQPGQTGQVLAQHRVALMRHGRGALLAGMEELLRFAHFGALQVAHLGCQALNAAGHHGEGREEGRVAVTRDDLGADGFDRQAEFFGDEGLDPRIHTGKSANGAGDGAAGDFGAGRLQPRQIAGELGIMAGEFQAKGGGFGMNAVAAANGGGVFMFQRPGPQGCQQGLDALDQQIGRAGELHGQGCVQHVGTRHALMHETGILANALGHPGEEGDDVMPRHPLYRVDCLDGGGIDGGGAGGALVADVVRGGGGDGAEAGHSLGGQGLDLEPDAEAFLR